VEIPEIGNALLTAYLRPSLKSLKLYGTDLNMFITLYWDYRGLWNLEELFLPEMTYQVLSSPNPIEFSSSLKTLGLSLNSFSTLNAYKLLPLEHVEHLVILNRKRQTIAGTRDGLVKTNYISFPTPREAYLLPSLQHWQSLKTINGQPIDTFEQHINLFTNTPLDYNFHLPKDILTLFIQLSSSLDSPDHPLAPNFLHRHKYIKWDGPNEKLSFDTPNNQIHIPTQTQGTLLVYNLLKPLINMPLDEFNDVVRDFQVEWRCGRGFVVDSSCLDWVLPLLCGRFGDVKGLKWSHPTYASTGWDEKVKELARSVEELSFSTFFTKRLFQECDFSRVTYMEFFDDPFDIHFSGLDYLCEMDWQHAFPVLSRLRMDNLFHYKTVLFDGWLQRILTILQKVTLLENLQEISYSCVSEGKTASNDLTRTYLQWLSEFVQPSRKTKIRKFEVQFPTSLDYMLTHASLLACFLQGDGSRQIAHDIQWTAIVEADEWTLAQNSFARNNSALLPCELFPEPNLLIFLSLAKQQGVEHCVFENVYLPHDMFETEVIVGFWGFRLRSVEFSGARLRTGLGNGHVSRILAAPNLETLKVVGRDFRLSEEEGDTFLRLLANHHSLRVFHCASALLFLEIVNFSRRFAQTLKVNSSLTSLELPNCVVKYPEDFSWIESFLYENGSQQNRIIGIHSFSEQMLFDFEDRINDFGDSIQWLGRQDT